MSAIQLDGLPGPPQLDLLPLPSRAEQRGDDSFEDLFRRADSLPPRKDDRPPQAAATRDDQEPANSDSSSSTPPKNDSPATANATQTQPAKQSNEDDPTSAPESADASERAGEEAETSPAADVHAVLIQTDDIQSAVDRLTEIGGDEEALSGGVGKLAGLRAPTNLSEQETGVTADQVQADQTLLPDSGLASESATQRPDSPASASANPTLRPGQAKSDSKSHAPLDAHLESRDESAIPVVDEFSTADVRRSSGQRRDRTGEERQGQNDRQTPIESLESGNVTALAGLPTDQTDGSDSMKGRSKGAQAQELPARLEGAGVASRLPQHLLSAAGELANERTAGGKPPAEVDQARFVHRVARAFQTAANQEGELRLRLSPPELGSLRLEVKVLGGVMSARVEAESSAARTLLLENLPVLRERLAEQNIRLEQFDVDLMDRQASGQPGGPPQDQGRQTSLPADAAARFRLTEEAPTESTAPRISRRSGGEGQLNVLV